MFGRKRNKEQKENKLQDKVAGKIAGAGIKLQTEFANGMNALFADISLKNVKIILLLFCFCTGVFSIYLVANAIFSSDKKQPSFKVDQVNVPKHFDKTGNEVIPDENYVDEETYNQVQGFKQYMDSLKVNKSKLYDSIMITRPGLMDSILMLEQIYNSQKQNEAYEK